MDTETSCCAPSQTELSVIVGSGYISVPTALEATPSPKFLSPKG
jgi:hypothetical protein